MARLCSHNLTISLNSRRSVRKKLTCVAVSNGTTAVTEPPMMFSSMGGMPEITADSANEHQVRNPFHRWSKRPVLYSAIQARKYVGLRDAPKRFEDLEFAPNVCPLRRSCNLTLIDRGTQEELEWEGTCSDNVHRTQSKPWIHQNAGYSNEDVSLSSVRLWYCTAGDAFVLVMNSLQSMYSDLQIE